MLFLMMLCFVYKMTSSLGFVYKMTLGLVYKMTSEGTGKPSASTPTSRISQHGPISTLNAHGPLIPWWVFVGGYYFRLLTFSDCEGLHRDKIDTLISEWEKLSAVSPQIRGMAVLKALREREKPFLFAEGEFDFPGEIWRILKMCGLTCFLRVDHPFKAVPLKDIGNRVSLQDALYDLSRINEEQHADIVWLQTSEMLSTAKSPSGVEMERDLLRYMQTRKDEDFARMRLPLSIPHNTRCKDTSKGLLNWDPSPHIPENMRWASWNEEWKSALVAAPAFTPVHADHIFCGQMMAHLFGHKVWLSFHQNKVVLMFLLIY